MNFSIAQDDWDTKRFHTVREVRRFVVLNNLIRESTNSGLGY